MWLALTLHAALAGTPQALVVVTPGMGRPNFQALVDELDEAGVAVHVASFSCARGGVDDLVADLLAEVASHGGPDDVVVAHGYGATLALLAAERGLSQRLVLLAPVLGPLPGPLGEWLVQQPMGASLDLGGTLRWHERSVWTTLVGGPSRGGCVAAAAAREAQGWLSTGPPLHLDAIDNRVWLGLSAGDQLSPVEVAIPASRALSHRELVRFGINRFDERDFRHGELLVAPEVLRAVRREVLRP